MTMTTSAPAARDIDLVLSGSRVVISSPEIAALTPVERAVLAAHLRAEFPSSLSAAYGAEVTS